MKKLLVMCVLVAVSASGCGVAKGLSRAVNHVGQGVAAITAGIEEDCTSGSDGYSEEYHRRNNAK